MKVTNVYILIDKSFKMQRKGLKIQQTITQYKRALELQKEKANLIVIGYNDRAKILSPFSLGNSNGNPNLAQGLSLLSSLIEVDKNRYASRTKSVFLLFSGENVLQGWQPELQKLFGCKDFAFGLRYVITQAKPDRYLKSAINSFVDTQDKVLYHFSASRLSSLVKNLHLA